MAKAICLQCGEGKKIPWAQCPSCQFDPMTDEEALVKSVYLSTGRYDDDEQQTQYMKELDAMASLIRSGRTPAFDAHEMERLRQQKRDVESIKPWGPAIAVFLFLLPALVFLAILYGSFLLLKSCQ